MERINWELKIFFFKVKAEKFKKFAKISNFLILKKNVTRDTPSIDSDHLCHIRKESIQNGRCYKADTIFLVKAKWPWRYRSRSKVITCHTPSHASDHLYQIWKESIKNCRCYRADTIFKTKAKWPWRYRSRSKVIICNTPNLTSDHLC